MWAQVRRGSSMLDSLPQATCCCALQQNLHSAALAVRFCSAGLLILLMYGFLQFVSLQDDATAESGQALQAAGIKLGTDVLLQLSGLVRGGRDSVHAECKVDSAAEQLSLRKVR